MPAGVIASILEKLWFVFESTSNIDYLGSEIACSSIHTDIMESVVPTSNVPSETSEEAEFLNRCPFCVFFLDKSSKSNAESGIRCFQLKTSNQHK